MKIPLDGAGGIFGIDVHAGGPAPSEDEKLPGQGGAIFWIEVGSLSGI